MFWDGNVHVSRCTAAAAAPSRLCSYNCFSSLRLSVGNLPCSAALGTTAAHATLSTVTAPQLLRPLQLAYVSSPGADACTQLHLAAPPEMCWLDMYHLVAD